MVTRFVMKSDEQIGQLIRELAFGKFGGLLYFLTTCLRDPRDCCSLKLMILMSNKIKDAAQTSLRLLGLIVIAELSKCSHRHTQK